jgi:hypothetical protein
MKKVLLSLGFAGLVPGTAMAEPPPPEKAKPAAAKPAPVDANAVKRAPGGTTVTTGGSKPAELVVKMKNGTAAEPGKLETAKEPGKLEAAKEPGKLETPADKKELRPGTATAVKTNTSVTTTKTAPAAPAVQKTTTAK